MKKVRVRSCDWCNHNIQTTGKYADPFVINAERKIFCKVHYKGHEPDRDCMSEYLKNNKEKTNDKISSETKFKEKEKEEKKEEEKKIVAFQPIGIQKLKALQKHFQNGPTKSSFR